MAIWANANCLCEKLRRRKMAEAGAYEYRDKDNVID